MGDCIETESVLEALRDMRPPFALYEADIHAMVGECLVSHGFACVHEARIGKGCRIDFLIGGIGVEIKKGKPSPTTLRKQLLRYAVCDALHSLIVVSQRSVSLPVEIAGKRVDVIALSQLWGVSLP
mgnify:CR=1 FL=1